MEQQPLKISFSEDNLICVISIYRKRTTAQTVSSETIFNVFNKRKFQFQLSKKIVENKLWQFLKSSKLDHKFSVMADPLLEISEYADVTISQNEMSAALSMTVPANLCGKFSIPIFQRILRSAKVHTGILTEQIEKLVEQFNSSPGHINNLIVAQGIPEIMGQNGDVKLSEKFKHHVKIKKSQKNPNSEMVQAQSTDYDIKKDDILIRILPAVKGKQGTTVTGKKIWSSENVTQVRTPSVTVSRNVKEVINPNFLDYIAITSGKAFFIENKIIDLEEVINGRFQLDIPDDNLSCKLVLSGPKGGKKLSFERIKQVIEENEIILTMELKEIEETIKELNQINEAKVKNIIIAKGNLPVNGKDEEINWDINIDNIYVPTIKDSGDVDFKSSNPFPFIRKGEEAGILYLATKGETPGVDIYGKEIKAEDGKNINIQISDFFDQQDKTIDNRPCKVLLSKVSGIVKKDKTNIIIEPVFEAKMIDYSTGNVDFDGTVIIKDSIQDGFKVKATKDIQIKGSVGACSIESEETIIIKGGMNGRGKGRIISNKDIIVKYAENCTLFAKGKILIESHALLSNVISLDNIIIGKNRKNGKVIGSNLYSFHKIGCNTVGAQTSNDSSLWAGINKPYYDRLLKIKRDIDINVNELSAIQIELSNNKNLTNEHKEELLKKKDLILKKQETLNTQKEQIHRKAFTNNEIEIEVINEIKENSLIQLAEEELSLIGEKSKVKFSLEDGKIHTKELAKKK